MSRVTTPAVSGGAASRQRADAAARLYIEYRERIYRFCYTRLRSREEAEDAAQNVFMRVHMSLDRGVVPEYEAAWLYKIAHNVCLSRIDSNARRGGEELHTFDEQDVQIAAPEVSADELAGLNEALEAMPHNLRTAILLREWQGLSYAEIAVAMGLSVSAVETLIFRARRHLAWALEHPGEKPKTAVGRLLDLLGLGALRNLFLGAGPVAKLAAGAALLALGGGSAAVALTTGAHSRPAPPAAHVPPSAPEHVVAVTPSEHAATGAAARHRAAATPKRVSDTSGVRHSVPAIASVGAGAVRAPAAPKPAAGGSTVSAPAAAPKPGAPAPKPVQIVTSPIPAVTVPAVSTPAAQAPTVTVPTVSVPTVTVPPVSVPTVSVPTVSLPLGGGLLGGK
jgi:RNA polymerase sigma factor (sigma-70 family)